MNTQATTMHRAFGAVLAAVFALALAVLVAAMTPAAANAETTLVVKPGASFNVINIGSDVTDLDVTGDGVTDTVRVGLIVSKADPDAYRALVVRINGKQALYRSEDQFYSIQVRLYTLGNGAKLMRIGTTGDNAYETNILYRYRSGKLVKVLNFGKLLGGKAKYGSYYKGRITKLGYNVITIRASFQSNFCGSISGVFKYRYKNGVMKRLNTVSKARYVTSKTDKVNAYLTVADEFIGYKDSTCTVKKCTFVKGNSVKIVKLCWDKQNTLHYLLKGKKGTTAWAKNRTHCNEKTASNTWFRQMYLAG